MASRADLSQEIKYALKKLHKDEGPDLDDDCKWAKAVKRTLCELCNSKDKREGHRVYASSVNGKADRGEFLFDVCWLRYDNGYLANVELVVECEWGNDDEIDDDFQKLMIANKQDYSEIPESISHSKSAQCYQRASTIMINYST